MLFSIGHGTRIILPSDGATESGTIPGGTKRLSAVAPGAQIEAGPASDLEAGLSGGDAQSFGYMFPDGDGVSAVYFG